jgi:hypothetical protein
VRALLPRHWEESLLDARLRWTPEQIRMGTLFTRRDRESFRFEQIFARPEDSAVTSTRSPVEGLESTAQVGFRPLEAVTAELTFFSVRDLLSPEDATRDPRMQPVLEEERAGIGPIDLGWETNRVLRTRLGLRPSLASWLRTDLAVSSDYSSDRNAALAEEVVVGFDTVLVLQRNANGNRTSRATVSLDPGDMARAVLGGEAGGVKDPSSLVRMMEAFDPLFLSRQGGLSARYFRRPVDPGAGFQFGLGGREDLRFLDGDTASIFTGQTTWSGGTGVRLPLGLRVSGNFSESRTQILHVRSDRELRNRTWPDLRVILPQLALPEAVGRVMESFSLASGFRKTSTATSYGGRGLQERRSEERQIPLELSAVWAGEITTRYQGSVARGEGEDPTGGTRSRRFSHTFLLSSSLADPPFLGRRLDGPLRLSMGYQYSSQLDCRIPEGKKGCVAFVDFLNRSVNLTLDTVILPLEVGLHFTYTNRRSFVGQHDGSTQFQLGLFGEFLFDSGVFTPPSSPEFKGGS